MNWTTDIKILNDAPLDRLVFLFDNGEWLPYLQDDWPFAQAIAWFVLPEFPENKKADD